MYQIISLKNLKIKRLIYSNKKNSKSLISLKKNYHLNYKYDILKLMNRNQITTLMSAKRIWNATPRNKINV